MLPSMPSLMTPIKVTNEDSSDTSNDSPVHNNLNEHENSHGQHSAEDHNLAMDENDELLSLEINTTESCHMIINSSSDNIRDKSRSPDKRSSSEPSLVQKKKKKNHHRKMLAALTPDTGASLDDSAQNFAESYFQKVRSRLDDGNWNLFLQELVDFEEREEEREPAKLYQRMEAVLLAAGAGDLAEQFLAFLLPEQALAAGHIMPFLDTHRIMDFCRKLNILLMKRQVRQVLDTLERLNGGGGGPAPPLQEVKDAVLPLFKSSQLLTDRFLQLLPPERPPDSLMVDFETVDLKDNSQFETVSVPDLPDPYGHDNCICACHHHHHHGATPTALQAHGGRHCIRCGIKYVNGRVYVQHGKALRPAKVTFKGAKHADLRKWEDADKCRSRRRICSLPMSPHPHTHPSAAHNNPDSEDDCGVKKSPKTQKTPRRVSKSKANKKEADDAKDEVLDGISPLTQLKNADVIDDLKQNIAEESEERHNENYEHDFDEIVMEECNTEEEEEEELMNKVVHSDNDSCSLEAEDLSKELESGYDCSFEDEELEDFEDLDIVRDDSPKHTEDELKDMFEFHNHASNNIAENDSFDSDRELVLSAPLDKSDDETKVENHICVKQESTGVKTEDGTGAEVEIKVEYPDVQETKREDVGNVAELGTSTSGPVNIEQMNSVSVVPSPGGGEWGASSATASAAGEWTREEDKIILQTFQHENGLEQTFETASLQLPNRSKEQIQQRFEVLLKLLKEMISDESSSS